MSEADKELVRKIQAAWNSNAIDELDQYFAPDFVARSNAPGMPPGPGSSSQTGRPRSWR
jgi:ketosteroid isomerase-like protein